MTTTWRWVTAVVMAGLTASAAQAGESDFGPQGRTLIVRTYNSAGVPARDLAIAEATAGHVFEVIGIRVSWRNCESSRHALPIALLQCDKPVTAAEVILRLGAAGPGAPQEYASMGFALVSPSAGRNSVLATVFPDRVLDVARSAGVDPCPLLGLAIGHELGHLLLSTHAHASSGLMRAIWSQAELRRTNPGGWRFLDDEAHLIQDEVTRRTSGCATEAQSVQSPNEYGGPYDWRADGCRHLREAR